MDWPKGPLPLALAGGFLLAAPAVRAALLSELETFGYDPVPTTVPEPVVGAVILAVRVLERLITSKRDYLSLWLLSAAADSASFLADKEAGMPVAS